MGQFFLCCSCGGSSEAPWAGPGQWPCPAQLQSPQKEPWLTSPGGPTQQFWPWWRNGRFAAHVSSFFSIGNLIFLKACFSWDLLSAAGLDVTRVPTSCHIPNAGQRSQCPPPLRAPCLAKPGQDQGDKQPTSHHTTMHTQHGTHQSQVVLGLSVGEQGENREAPLTQAPRPRRDRARWHHILASVGTYRLERCPAQGLHQPGWCRQESKPSSSDLPCSMAPASSHHYSTEQLPASASAPAPNAPAACPLAGDPLPAHLESQQTCGHSPDDASAPSRSAR